uniref:Uncharacterized protein n=1 Tax=Callorhinchus milii TaxID=7868 RepID=A0A4W3IWP5_CALMI
MRHTVVTDSTLAHHSTEKSQGSFTTKRFTVMFLSVHTFFSFSRRGMCVHHWL